MVYVIDERCTDIGYTDSLSHNEHWWLRILPIALNNKNESHCSALKIRTEPPKETRVLLVLYPTPHDKYCNTHYHTIIQPFF